MENFMSEDKRFHHFKLNEIARAFPDTAETLLLDKYLTDEEGASARVFRVYRETPPHYHMGSDEHLYVLSGRGTFWMEDASNAGEFAPGDLLVFKRRTVHALPEILESPVVFLAIDTPRRDPKDIVFVNPADGTPESFIRGQEQQSA
jgi:mannose-6-phosphate isomerase-like protein (cupin superfamily)